MRLGRPEWGKKETSDLNGDGDRGEGGKGGGVSIIWSALGKKAQFRLLNTS